MSTNVARLEMDPTTRPVIDSPLSRGPPKPDDVDDDPLPEPSGPSASAVEFSQTTWMPVLVGPVAFTAWDENLEQSSFELVLVMTTGAFTRVSGRVTLGGRD